MDLKSIPILISALDRNILHIIFLICLVAGVLVVSSFLFFWFFGDSFYYKRIIQDSRVTREYIVDVKNNVVTYFDRINLKRKVVIDLNGFYIRFHENDIGKLKSWIYRILQNDISFGDVLEIDVKKNHGRLVFFSILRLISYDEKVGKIHLENIVLKNITPNNVLSKPNLFFRWKKNTCLSSYEEIEETISKEKSLDGYTFVAYFFNKHNIVKKEDKTNRFIICSLKNEFFRFAIGFKKHRHIVDIDGNEIVLCDLKMSSENKALELANDIIKKLKSFLQIYGYSDDVDVSLGVIKNSEYYQDLKSILEFGKLAALDAHSKNKDYVIFERSHAIEYKNDDYEHEITKLFKPNGICVSYRPIISLNNISILGYFDYVRSKSGKFSTYQIMSRYAYKEGKNEALFKRIVDDVVMKFSNEHYLESDKLFLRISFWDCEYLIDALTEVKKKVEIKIVVVFDETEIKDNVQSINEFQKVLKDAKGIDVESAILLHDDNLLLNPTTYAFFDYFVVGNKVIGEIKVNNQVRLSIHTLIEQLLKYKRPIIVTDLDSWQTIELLIKSGISYVSSEVIIASQETIVPVDKKKMDKLEAMYDKYR